MSIVTSSNGFKYRVQFVHSAHDLKQSRAQDNPGGLRQFVDNLAASLRRRVTLSEIALMEEIPAKRGVPAVMSYLPVAQGFAVCHFTDQFVKEDGRGRAFLRALKLSGLSRTIQDELANALGYAGVAELKDRYGSAHPLGAVRSIDVKSLGKAEYPKTKTKATSGSVNACKCADGYGFGV